MKDLILYPAGSTKACQHAGIFLQRKGLSLLDHPAPEITHLLLDVPSFRSDGLLRSGESVEQLLERLPEDIIIVGGNLRDPILDGYRCLDLLQDETYLAVNAAITAQCVIPIAARNLPVTLSETPVLILGWGRIGKILSTLLKALGCEVTVAARREESRAMITALGLRAMDSSEAKQFLSVFRLVINTVPELLLTKKDFQGVKNCVKIDLASKSGMEGEDVIIARGLPGIHAPESSGKLIADTFLRLYKEVY